MIRSVGDAVSRARELAAAAPPDRRAILGITGAPGAGKSTLAIAMIEALGADLAVLVGMDGYHLTDSLLRRLGRWERKGAPDTFDAAAYADLLGRLGERGAAAFAPVFDRDRELAEVGGMLIPAGVPLVITEGNYLLHDEAPWNRVGPLLTESWYVAPDEATRRDRLLHRHLLHGRSQLESSERVLGSDEANARVVAAGRARADVVVSLG